MHHAIVRCGLSPQAFWSLSWWEYSLICEQQHYQQELDWSHTRSIIAALTGEKPSVIMPLSFDKEAVSAAPSMADRERIKNQWQHVLTPTHGN